ncbi:restriction endonuclease subunit S [Candidatus Kurthia intestinigallinarum]|uniref:restriction endonuclease subunit S n=1 Tax=Candidatus Kurthia intestinigallinarum TaxID=1562256 RepID=UPI000F8CE82B|nr:restriction endonuclease subunit S [Kurthia sp. 3B1D]
MSKIKELDVPWLGDLPENWRVLKLKYLCEINTGSKDTQDKIPDGKYPFFVRSPHIESLNEFTHDEEAVMTAGDGVGVGKVFHYYEGKFAAHQRVYVFTKFKNVLGKYLYYYVMSNLKFEVLMGGAKSTVDSLRRPMLSEFPVVFPMINVQDKIVKYLDRKVKQLNYLINSKEKYISLLEKQRQSIITEAVTKGLNPNVKMKESGVEWIGEIPEHWEASKLKNMFILQRGHDLTHEQFNKGIVPVYASNGIMGYHDLITTKGPNVTVGRSGSVGKVNYVECDFWAHNTCIYVKDSKKNNMKYIYYILKSLDMGNLSTQTAVPTLDRKNIQNSMFVYTLDIEEQREIVIYLDRKLDEIETTIGVIEKQINSLKEYRQALIYEAVTGKIDVRDMELD